MNGWEEGIRKEPLYACDERKHKNGGVTCWRSSQQGIERNKKKEINIIVLPLQWSALHQAGLVVLKTTTICEFTRVQLTDSRFKKSRAENVGGANGWSDIFQQAASAGGSAQRCGICSSKQAAHYELAFGEQCSRAFFAFWDCRHTLLGRRWGFPWSQALLLFHSLLCPGMFCSKNTKHTPNFSILAPKHFKTKNMQSRMQKHHFFIPENKTIDSVWRFLQSCSFVFFL